MGRKGRKGFNWKARQNNKPETRKTSGDVVKDLVQIPGVDALPSRKKRLIELKEKKVETKKRLSKKEKRKLSSILKAKAQKTLRTDLLERLAEVQAKPEDLKCLTSTSDMQTRKIKRKRTFDEKEDLQGQEKKLHVEEISESENDSDDSDLEFGSPQVAAVSSQQVAEMSNQPNSKASSQQVAKVSHQQLAEASSQQVPKGGSLKVAEVKVDEVKSQQKEICEQNSVLVKPPVQTDQKEETREHIKKVHITVNRTEEIQKQRELLPIYMEEQMIMENINENPVVIICGETGSGKTTQVPQFLYEAGYAHSKGIIGVTQPRRVAAVSMSKRVAKEMGLPSGEVSYQIRFDRRTVTENTKIKFMTDGILLKELQEDCELLNYSVIILDEAHERSVYTDILLGLLSRVIKIRKKNQNPLKLILMSATLRVADFTENRNLFDVPPPVIEVKARQFEVTVHFNRQTPAYDYLGEAFKKVCKIHRTLPHGGILVFVTSRQEVETLCSKLRRAYPFRNTASAGSNEKLPLPKKQRKCSRSLRNLPKVDLDNYSSSLMANEGDGDGDIIEDSDNENFESEDEDEETLACNSEGSEREPIYALPLYSMLAEDKQEKVFEKPPSDCRLCIVATNVAETSITIPNIKYVVDTGKVKTKLYDNVTGVSTFHVTWISKASANQRMGRAGRTGPGHCYRLYSSAVFMDFEEFSDPEIMRRPVDDLFLVLKDIGVPSVVNFPFPTPPPMEALQVAEKHLIRLGALAPDKTAKPGHKKGETVYEITGNGAWMAKFPVAPAFAKILLVAKQNNLLSYAIILISALSVQEVFIDAIETTGGEEEKEELTKKWLERSQMKRQWAGTGNSLLLGDVMVLLKAVCNFEREKNSKKFCDVNGIRYKAMIEIRKLRQQLTNIVNEHFPTVGLVLDPQLDPPSDPQAQLLRMAILCGLGNHVARKIQKKDGLSAEEARKLRYAYQDSLLADPVYIHPNSVLYRSNCEYVVYQTVEEASSTKIFMKGVTAIEPAWLPQYVPTACHFSEPEKDPAPFFDTTSGLVMCYMSSTFGPQHWQLPITTIQYPQGLERSKYFAQYFLMGRICKKLKKFCKDLLSPPETMIKPFAHLIPRTQVLLASLVSRKVDSRNSLLEVWKTDSQYLQNEYLQWVPSTLHNKVCSVWPPL